jgi:hypothetical protein
LRRLLSPSFPPRWSASGLAWTAIGFLGVVHGAAIWAGIGGWAGLIEPWPLYRHDHLFHFHAALLARPFFVLTATNAGYDPSFMAGYGACVIPQTSSTLAQVVVGLFGAKNPVLVYKLYVAVAAALVPWFLVGAGVLCRFPPGAIGVAVLLDLLYLWTDFPINYVEFGMVAYFLAVPLGLAATAAVTVYLERGGAKRWLLAAGGCVLVFLVHLTSALIVGPAALLAYLFAVFEARRSGTSFPAGRHLGFWCIPIAVLTANAFWWLPGFWLRSTTGKLDITFTHREGVLRRLGQIVVGEAPIESVLWASAGLGLAVLARHRRVTAVGLGAFLGSGFFWGYLAGAFRWLDPLQPGRHTYALYTAAALLAGVGVSEVLVRVRGVGVGVGRLDLWLAAGAILVGLRLFGPSVGASAAARLGGPEPFLTSRPPPRLRWVVENVKRHVPAGERLLYEEGGMARPGFPDLFQGGRYSGLLPYLAGVEVLGGPYLHVPIRANFTQFGEGRLFGREDWDRDHFVRYARLYRPSAILCWSPHARAFCQANPDLIERLADDGLLLLGRVHGFAGAAIVGDATVEAEPGRLNVRGVRPGVDGTVVLRYHSVPSLRVRPGVAWDSVYLERDPVPFIRLRPPLGPVTLELGFPPEPENRVDDRP